jgi:hypothetical protein
MGSPESERGRGPNTEDQLAVTVTHGLAVGAHEVTQGEWQAQGFPNPSGAADWGADCIGASCPVGNVN